MYWIGIGLATARMKLTSPALEGLQIEGVAILHKASWMGCSSLPHAIDHSTPNALASVCQAQVAGTWLSRGQHAREISVNDALQADLS
jgi:hypothetical protein